MKLLVCVSEYYPHGAGIANVAYYVVSQLRKMGVDCTVCSPAGPDIKLGSNSMIGRYGRLGLFHYWHKVATYFQKETDKYDAVWLHNPMFIKRNPFAKSLVTIHVTSYEKTVHRKCPLHLYLYYQLSSVVENRSLNKIALSSLNIMFTAVSPHVLEELTSIGIAPEIITCISNGVDTRKFKPSGDKNSLRKKFNLPENELILLSLGRLTAAKQPYQLIEVFSIIEKQSKDITLVVAGDGELLRKTRKLTARKGLEKVRFMGYLNHDKDVPALYSCSDYYIMTSEFEGQPLTLLEAMASGLPCIVSDIPALRIVKQANCGIVVDFNSVEKVASQIIEYLGKDNTCHSRCAREYAVSNLDWEIIAGRYLAEFKKLV